MNSRSHGALNGNSMQNVFAEIDDLIRRGLGHKAVPALRKLVRQGPSRDERVVIANLARRCGDPMFSLAGIRPIVRPASGLESDASPQEKICYAASLIAIGSGDEAFALLNGIDCIKFPEVLFHTALARIGEWRYEEAIPILRQYVQSALITEYQRVVGNLNLSGAYIFMHQYQEAEVLLKTLLEDIDRNFPQAFLIRGVALEYMAQIKIALGKYPEAFDLLSSSAEVHRGADHVHRLTLEKWRIVASFESHRNASMIGDRAVEVENQKVLRDQFRVLRTKAISSRSWETARECDFFLARLFFDWDSYMCVRFGSPMSAYQKRLDETFGSPNENSCSKFDWAPQKEVTSIRSVSVRIDLSSGLIHLKGGKTLSISELRPGLMPLRLLNLLCEDFYRPVRIGQVFRQLYPAEYFDPFSSPNRIAQIVLRVNQLFRSSGIDFSVSQQDIGFTINAGEGIVISKSFMGSPMFHPYESSLRTAKFHLQNTKFSCSDFKNVVCLSSRSAERVLRWGVEKKLLQRNLAGRSTSYCFIG